MLSLLFIALASFCNSTMDTTSTHWGISIFRNIKNKFFHSWFKDDSWKLKYKNGDPSEGRLKWTIFKFKINKPVQITDSWHFFKMLMIIFICISVLLYTPFIFITDYIFVNKIIELLIYGTVWNVTFSAFYNKIFISK